MLSTLIFASMGAVTSSTWIDSTPGVHNWDDGSNWDTNPTFPNGVGDIATFPSSSSVGEYTIVLGTPITVGTINFNVYPGATAYEITSSTASDTLTFSGVSGTGINVLSSISPPTVVVATLSSDLVLGSNLNINTQYGVDTQDIYIFSGDISGASGKNINIFPASVVGPVGVSFTGTNTYLGETRVNGGADASLAVTLTGTTDSLQGVVELSDVSSLVFDQSGDGDFLGTIGFSSSVFDSNLPFTYPVVNKSNNNTVTFPDHTTCSIPTLLISSGTLELANGIGPSITFNQAKVLVKSGMLLCSVNDQFNHGVQVHLGEPFLLSHQLTKTEEEESALVANFSIGSTTQTIDALNVSNGILTIGMGGELILIDAVTALYIEGDFSTSVEGTISLPNQGQMFADSNSFAEISCAVELGSSPTIFRTESDMRVSGPISDAGGGLRKLGGSPLTLSNTNPLTGTVHVEEGTLIFDQASVGGSCIVHPNAIFLGDGAINGSLNSAGLVFAFETMSGQSPGTIAVGNSLSLGSSSMLGIGILPNGISSVLDVQNSASLGGTLVVRLPPNGTSPVDYKPGTSWTILTTSSGTISGAFSKFSFPNDLPGLIVRYPNSHTIELFLRKALIPVEGLSGNTKIVADYLNSLGDVPDLRVVMGELVYGLNLQERIDALNAISPLRIASTRFSLLQSQLFVNSSIEERLRLHAGSSTRRPFLASASNLLREDELLALSGDTRLGLKYPPVAKEKPKRQGVLEAWVDGLGASSHQVGEDTNPSFTLGDYALLLGVDYDNCCSWLGGAMVGYLRNQVCEGDSAGSSTSSLYMAAVYTNYSVCDFFFDLVLLGSYSDISQDRHIVFEGFIGTASSAPHAWGISPHLGFGYLGCYRGMYIQPFVNLDWPILFSSSFSEEGASPLNMDVESNASSMLRSQVGVSFYQKKRFHTGCFGLKESLSYVNKTAFSVGSVSAALVGQVGSFTVETFTGSQNLFCPLIELFFQGRGGVNLAIFYQGEFGSGYRANQVVGQLGFRF